MSKQSNHKSNMGNPNKKTSGQNETYSKNQDNRSMQLNPNNPRYKEKNSKK